MKLLRHLSALAHTAYAGGCVATIGNFDGIHRGHQQVIAHVQAKAAELHLPSTIISFEPLPAEYFRKPPPTRILPLRDKIQQLQCLNVDQFVCLPFNSTLAEMEPEAFVRQILLEGLKARYLVVGDDFRFGRQRRGDYALLQKMGAEAGMQVLDMPTFLHSEARVSSTWIRQALAQADLDLAERLLGRPYQLSGRVRHGDKRGRTIGFPTLNLRIPENVALAKGVYAIKAFGLGEQVLNGVANVGARPTVNGFESRLEVHLFDFSAQVYHQHISIQPIAFLRPEQKFPSFADLHVQIKKDAEQARDLLR